MSYGRKMSLGPRGRDVLYAPLGATNLAIDPAAGVGATAVRIEKEWHPTGYYTPKDVINIAGQLGKVYAQVRAPLATYLTGSNPFRGSSLDDRARAALTKLDLTQQQALRYSTIAVNAAAQGMKYIDAPGLKAMVVGYLRSMSIGVSTYQSIQADYNAAVAAMIREAGGVIAGPALDWFLTKTGLWPAVQAAGEAIMKIAGVAANVVRAAADLVVKIPDTIGTLLTVVKWGVILGGGIFLYRELKEARLVGS